MPDWLVELWLPILVSGGALFFTSYVLRMILPLHTQDRTQLNEEREFIEFLVSQKIQPGNYAFPHPATNNPLGESNFDKRFSIGPRGLIDVYDFPNVGVNLFLTLLYFVITTALIAFACSEAFWGWDPSAITFWRIFRVISLISLMTHTSALIMHGIWFRRHLIADCTDGLIYGAITGFIFAWFHACGWGVFGGVGVATG